MDVIELLIFNWQDRLHPLAGGAETHLHAIFGRLAARGHGVTLVSSGFEGAPHHTSIDGIEVHRTGNRFTYPIAARGYYRGALRGRRFDLVIEDLNKVPLATPLWVREPVVLLVHHLFGRTAFAAASAPVALVTIVLERLLMPLYARCSIIAVSESSAEDARRNAHHPDRVAIVYNGVDRPPVIGGTSADVDSARHEPMFLVLGRLQRYKRVDLAIRALARLRETGTPARLVIAGRGPEEARLRALAARLGIAGEVDFRGFVSEADKQSLLASALAHLNTSVKEGWGINILEAAASGTATIASDSPGLRDAVRHDETGVLVPHGDADALATAMRRVVLEPAYINRLSAAARVYARTFTWDRSTDAIELALHDAYLHSRRPSAQAPLLPPT